MPKKQLSIRLSKELDEGLRRIADKTEMSLNVLVNLSIRMYIERWNEAVEKAKKYDIPK